MQALVSTMMSPTSVFVVRRLLELGFEVTAVDPNKQSYGFYSKAVKKRIIVPSLREDPCGFVKAVLAEIKTGKYDIYVPIMECGFLMACYADTINKYSNMVTMPYESIMIMHDKTRTAAIAKEAGVPAPPETFAPTSICEAETICKNIDFPVVIKQCKGRNAHGQRVVMDPGLIFPTYKQLILDEERELPLIQRYINGSLVSTVNLAQTGTIVGNVVFKALRTVPIQGGTSSYRVTFSCPEAEEYDRRLIEHFNWHGFICFDYMQDEHTKKLYLIDCNPRMAPGLALGYHAGVDLIGAYMDMLLKRPVRPLKPQVPGVRSKMQFLDLGWLLFNLTDKNLSVREKWRCLRQWVKKEKYHYDILDARDIKPMLYLYKFIARHFFELFKPDSGEIFLEHIVFNNHIFNDKRSTDKMELITEELIRISGD